MMIRRAMMLVPIAFAVSGQALPPGLAPFQRPVFSPTPNHSALAPRVVPPLPVLKIRAGEPLASVARQMDFVRLVGARDYQGVVAVHFPDGSTIESRGRTNSGSKATVWRWASVTKQVVAVLVMQQVQRGAIELDAPISRYLPNIALPGADAVTVRRLLNHTSGLFDPEDGPKGPDGVPLTYRRADLPAATLDPQCLSPSGRAPGEFRYNNCDYVVLGAALEAVTGKRFATLVAERIARPLKLSSLRVLSPGDRDDVSGTDARGETDAAIDPGRYGSAANLAGTAEDLLAFDRALIDGTLLGKAATATMWAGDPKLGYAALGQWSYPVKLAGCAEALQVVERRGQVGNVQVRNLIAPARGVAIVAFAASTTPEFGEPWQGKGLTYDLLRVALCT